MLVEDNNTEEKQEEKLRKVLTRNEVRDIKLFTAEREKIRIETELLTERIRNRQLAKEILGLRMKLLDGEITNLNNEVSNNNRKAEEYKIKYANQIKELSSKYSLPEQWGFDQDTGEIIED